ncbi:hypothetical protein PCK1_000155 [Pneumocystis canis]|nr:hypothetical protein PCK1_000155 [Pneumocystis canis]
MTTFHYCIECNNMLYPREEKSQKRLLYACRNCNYSEVAKNLCIFRNELRSSSVETAGVTADLGSDPTLVCYKYTYHNCISKSLQPRSNKECPSCHARESVFFQSQGKQAETKMSLHYVCVNCGKVY